MNQTYINQHVSWRLMMVVVMLFVSASSRRSFSGLTVSIFILWKTCRG